VDSHGYGQYVLRKSGFNRWRHRIRELIRGAFELLDDLGNQLIGEGESVIDSFPELRMV
jgi:hypothetical protein